MMFLRTTAIDPSAPAFGRRPDADSRGHPPAANVPALIRIHGLAIVATNPPAESTFGPDRVRRDHA
jgi:hypothetical protein